MRASLIALTIGMLTLCIAGFAGARERRVQSPAKTIRWDRSTLTLVAERAGYGRMIRLTDGDILCAFGRRGSVCTSRRRDNGKTWSTPKLIVKYEFGAAANQ